VRVLVVSQFFPPEPGATQNRMGAFVEGLAARGHDVVVLCEQPNHPAGVFHPGYGLRPVITERDRRRTIHRLWVLASPQKTTGSRLAFYGTFAAGAGLGVLARRRPDVVFASSPPMPGPAAAAASAALRRIPFVLDVRDVWPAVVEALGEISNERVIRILQRAESAMYRTARRVTATTVPFCEHIDRVAGRPVSQHVPNGALDALVDLPYQPPPEQGKFVVGYAGNLGIAQGLEIVLDAAQRLNGADVCFRVLGEGPLSAELRRRQAEKRLGNVEILGSVVTDEVAEFMLACNALLVPLARLPLLEDFVPSKLYDAMAVGRPVIAAARGETARIVEQNGCGVVVEPEDGEQLAAAVEALASDRARARALGWAGREAAGPHARSRQIDLLERVLREACETRVG
jgi:glycosyltransferase involved in cell wall biosynthesis